MFTKKYFQDRPILFLNLVVVLGSLINIIAVLLRVDTSRDVSIVRYQAALGLSGYPKGSVAELYSFAVFAVLVTAISVFLSARLYTQKRALSVLLLWLTIITLFFNLIVSGAILNLQ